MPSRMFRQWFVALRPKIHIIGQLLPKVIEPDFNCSIWPMGLSSITTLDTTQCKPFCSAHGWQRCNYISFCWHVQLFIHWSLFQDNMKICSIQYANSCCVSNLLWGSHGNASNCNTIIESNSTPSTIRSLHFRYHDPLPCHRLPPTKTTPTWHLCCVRIAILIDFHLDLGVKHMVTCYYCRFFIYFVPT